MADALSYSGQRARVCSIHPCSIRYCRSLEEGSFGHRSADFLYCLLFGMAVLMAVAPWVNLMFFGSSLTFMLVYLWGKRNPGMQIRWVLCHGSVRRLSVAPATVCAPVARTPGLRAWRQLIHRMLTPSPDAFVQPARPVGV